MNLRRLLLTGLGLFSLNACATYQFTATNPNVSMMGRGENCTFQVLTTEPKRPFEELGILDLRRWDSSTPLDAGSFADRVRGDVCAAGGDAVLAQVNEQGVYLRGTILRYTDAPGAAANVVGSR